jgi:hypothetical protein
MSVQTTYSLNQDVAYAGLLAEMNPKTVITKAVETAAGIDFGVVVSRGTADEQCVVGGDAAGIGITCRTLDREGAITTGAVKYDQYDDAAIITEGYVYVPIYTASGSPGDDLFYNDTTGKIEVGTASTGETQMNATLEETVSSSGQIALIRLDSPLLQGEDLAVLTAAVSTNTTNIATNAAAITALGTPLQLKGSISLAADFPTSAAVEEGWTYLIAADVTDNDGTKTNTGQSFRLGDEIAWDGTSAWIPLGRSPIKQSYLQATAASETVRWFLASGTGLVKSVKAQAGAGAGTGESLTVDVQIGGVSCLSSVITLDAAAATTVQSGTIDTANDDLAANDVVTIVFAYTAGTPTPIVNTLVTVDFEQ